MRAALAVAFVAGTCLAFTGVMVACVCMFLEALK